MSQEDDLHIAVAVLKTEMKHTREALDDARREQEKMLVLVTTMSQDLQKLHDILTKASGVKLAFMLIGGGVAMVLTQIWNVLNWLRP